MRLTYNQISIIKSETKLVFGKTAHVYLFGSRVDDAKKGGDIDLIILTDDNTQNQRKKVDLLHVKLILALGDQKIDILVNSPHTNPSIIATALQTGILL
jgi:predicted nucleotidyltransferase